MTRNTPANDPCRQAYIDHSGAGNDRSSWDPATTLFAVRGASKFYTLHSSGHNTISDDGNNKWVDDGRKVNQSYLVLDVDPGVVKNAIDNLLVAAT